MSFFVRRLKSRAPLLGGLAVVAVSAMTVAGSPAQAAGHSGPARGVATAVDGSTTPTTPDDDPRDTASLAANAAGSQLSVVGLASGRVQGIDPIVLSAHQHAAEVKARTQAGCHLHWSLLAGIGQIESGNARSRTVLPNGDTSPHILGPLLNGGSFAAIRDTDGGRYDGDRNWDRAVGPMQFIPSSWQRWAADGNADGTADPNNAFDESLGAAGYLCHGGDLAVPAQLAKAVYSYNHSWDYVRKVLSWAAAFRTGQISLQPGSGTTAQGATPPTAAPAPGPAPTVPGSPGTPSPSPQPSPSPSPCPSPPPPSPTPSPSASPTASPTASPSPSPTPSANPTPSPSPTGPCVPS